MQNVGQQYGQGGTSSHQGTTYGHTESSHINNGSITSSLRQFRKKDVDKQQVNDTGTGVAESHVARVAPHNHYPPRPQDCYRYPSQYPDFSLPAQVKYSEISDHQPLQDQLSPSVIQKAKGKEYMEMCNVPQPHIKQSYPDHLGNQQPYATDHNLHPHTQYLHKESQAHASYKPESQYYPKESQYQQLSPQMQKYNVPPQMRKYPTENDFLSKLRRIHPTMARSIMSDHHLQEAQSSYQQIDQNRMYPHQNQRYMNYPSSLPNNPYPHGYMPPQPYPNYPPSCSYTRTSQMPSRFPSTNPHERSISPRRAYGDNLPIPPINYTAIPQRISPNYPQYNTPEYAQHYQHRRGPVTPQEFYPQPCRTAQYLPHQMAQQDVTENRVTVSDSIKQYIENWADEETASEMNQIEGNRLCKDIVRGREEQSMETVYMINASELQYIENGIPLVTSENGQYFLKSDVTIDNSTGVVRIIDKSGQGEVNESNSERVLNLQIMDPSKSDCMLNAKPNVLNQRQNESSYNTNDKPRVVVHQNTVIQPSQGNIPKEAVNLLTPEPENYQTTGSVSLPVLVENITNRGETPVNNYTDDIFKECKKETVDKNCSPINMEPIENIDDIDNTSEICPLKLLGHTEDTEKSEETENDDIKLKNMPLIDLLPEGVHNHDEDEKLNSPNKDCVVVKSEVPDTDTEESDELPSTSEDTSDDSSCNENINGTSMEENNNEKPKPEYDSLQDNASLENIKTEHESLIEKSETNEDSSENLKNQKLKVESKKQEVLSHTDSSNTSNKCNITEENGKEVNCDIETKSIEDKVEEKVENNYLEDNTDKITIRRTKRIFSVDDIINNIGSTSNKPKLDTQLDELRESTRITKDFLEREVEASKIFLKKSTWDDLMAENNCEEINENFDSSTTDTNYSSDTRILQDEEEEMTTEELNVNEEKKREPVEEKKDESITKDSEEIKIIEDIKEELEESPSNDSKVIKFKQEMDKIEECKTSEQPNSTSSNEQSSNLEIMKNEEFTNATNEVKIKLDTSDNQIKKETEMEINNTSESNIDTNPNPDITIDSISSLNETVSHTSCVVEKQETMTRKDSSNNINTLNKSDLNIKQNTLDETSQNEVQYRSAIRVEEDNVLLEIAGELVEISVNIVNGKKVITVVPLSESAEVDVNDNYEIFNTTQIDEPLESNVPETEQDLEMSQPVSEICPETEQTGPDILESTSEIIIGMDISLEAEIQLDLEKPLSLSTKAAKKSYENDLQIPSITTSEDIAANNQSMSYSPNDKVSSSKEQDVEAPKSKKRKREKTVESEKINSRPKKKFKLSEVENCGISGPQKYALTKKEAEEDVEDFVPFKELIKARKLKKKKLLQTIHNNNVTADSTNKLHQETSNEHGSETKLEECKTQSSEGEMENKTDKMLKEKIIENGDLPNDKIQTVNEIKMNNTLKVTNSDIETNVEPGTDCVKTEKNFNDQLKNSVENDAKVNTNTIDKKVIKRVTFGDVNYSESNENKDSFSLSKNYKLLDPRLNRNSVTAPSVSEVFRENEILYANNKKKLSLAEYINRKRKIINVDEQCEKKVKSKLVSPTTTIENSSTVSDNTKKKIEYENSKEQPPTRLKRIHRPKSLDDIKLFGEPKDNSLVKRKFSLEMTSKPNCFDWEETQSPKTNLNSQDTQKCLSEFKGLINDNKSKIILDVSEIKSNSTTNSDNILKTYKEQVDSKLSTLNLQIPRIAKSSNNIVAASSKSDTTVLMQRFLNNEKLTSEEMEKIKKIISYKRLMYELRQMKTATLNNSPLNPSYEIRKSCSEKDMKLHLKKVPEKKSRFRNLYTESSDESDSDFSDRKINGDYSVVQSNSLAAGVPKLIIKRKTELPVPVVRLERIDLKVMVNRKEKIC